VAARVERKRKRVSQGTDFAQRRGRLKRVSNGKSFPIFQKNRARFFGRRFQATSPTKEIEERPRAAGPAGDQGDTYENGARKSQSGPKRRGRKHSIKGEDLPSGKDLKVKDPSASKGITLQ